MALPRVYPTIYSWFLGPSSLPAKESHLTFFNQRVISEPQKLLQFLGPGPIAFKLFACKKISAVSFFGPKVSQGCWFLYVRGKLLWKNPHKSQKILKFLKFLKIPFLSFPRRPTRRSHNWVQLRKRWGLDDIAIIQTQGMFWNRQKLFYLLVHLNILRRCSSFIWPRHGVFHKTIHKIPVF